MYFVLGSLLELSIANRNDGRVVARTKAVEVTFVFRVMMDDG